MTCQCTCGKHILIDTSNSIGTATAAYPYDVSIFQANASAPTVGWVPNTRLADGDYPSMLGPSITAEP